MKKLWFLLLLPLLLAACSNGGADRVQRKGPAYKAGIRKENLGRGLVAIHNGDGKVSMAEAFDYAKSHDRVNETPSAAAWINGVPG